MRKHLAPVAVIVAAGVATLSACTSTVTAPAAQPNPAQAAQPPAANATGGPSLLPGAAKSYGAPAGTGDFAVPTGGVPTGATVQLAQKWAQLTAGSAGSLNPVVVNGAGLTLYRFDKDSPNPPTSNCADACAQTWPPVTVIPGGKIFIGGIDASAVATIARPDGSRQVTINGWPVYRFAKDTKPGDTLGQGVGGTWFGVTPNGERSGVSGADQAGTAIPATTAVLFDDANFSDNGASQGLAGPGCRNLSRPEVASSVAAPGALKLWSKPNCAGQSVVINGDVADLSTVNFDNKAASVFFG